MRAVNSQLLVVLAKPGAKYCTWGNVPYIIMYSARGSASSCSTLPWAAAPCHGPQRLRIVRRCFFSPGRGKRSVRTEDATGHPPAGARVASGKSPVFLLYRHNFPFAPGLDLSPACHCQERSSDGEIGSWPSGHGREIDSGIAKFGRLTPAFRLLAGGGQNLGTGRGSVGCGDRVDEAVFKPDRRVYDRPSAREQGCSVT